MRAQHFAYWAIHRMEVVVLMRLVKRHEIHDHELSLTFFLLLLQVAASHVEADGIIHFGHACLSKVARLPVHYVFPNFALNTTEFLEQIQKTVSNTDEDIVIFYSTGFFYQLGESFIHVFTIQH